MEGRWNSNRGTASSIRLFGETSPKSSRSYHDGSLVPLCEFLFYFAKGVHLHASSFLFPPLLYYTSCKFSDTGNIEDNVLYYFLLSFKVYRYTWIRPMQSFEYHITYDQCVRVGAH